MKEYKKKSLKSAKRIRTADFEQIGCTCKNTYFDFCIIILTIIFITSKGVINWD